jgi:hypothetical protein
VKADLFSAIRALQQLVAAEDANRTPAGLSEFWRNGAMHCSQFEAYNFSNLAGAPHAARK